MLSRAPGNLERSCRDAALVWGRVRSKFEILFMHVGSIVFDFLSKCGKSCSVGLHGDP